MFYVYILKSLIDGTFYVGQTANLEERLRRHNSGRSRYTKSKMPWELIYYEEFEDKTHSILRENEIKSWKSRKMIAKLVERPD